MNFYATILASLFLINSIFASAAISLNQSSYSEVLSASDSVVKTLTISNSGDSALAVNLVISDSDLDTLSFDAPDISNAPNNNKVLIFRNSLAWSKNSNSTVLTSLGATVIVMSSSAMDTATLENYELVVFESDQSNSFYQSYVSNFNRFEDYLSKGGKIQFHCATDNSDRITNMEFPGGLTLGGYSGESKNYAALRSHPVLENADSTLNGSSASHEYFTNVPANAHVVTTTLNGQPTTVAYRHLSGAILVTGMTWEHAYANSYSAGKPLLLNAFKYMLGLSVGPLWLNLSNSIVTVAPSSSESIDLKFISKGIVAGIHDGDIVISHNATNTASPLSIPCTLSISSYKTYNVLTDTIDFGTLTQGYSKTDTFTIENNGNDTLTVSSLGINNTVFSVQQSTPFTVVPFSRKELSVTYNAVNVVSESGIITINTDADVASQKFVYLKGSGVAAQRNLSSSKSSISFGDITMGENLSDTFTLTNSGNDTILIQPLVSSKGTFITNADSSFKLAPLANRVVNVTYSPVSAGVESGTLQINSNASDNPQIVISLSGKGITPPSISVSPAQFNETISHDDTIAKSITISNSGETPLDVVLVPVVNADTLGFHSEFISGAANDNKVLIFRNSLAWSKNSNSTVLTSLGATVIVMSSSAMDTATLENYELVVFESDQSNSFYQSYVNNFSRFEDYLAKGGKIQFHSATDNSDRITNMEFPGGLTLGGYSGESKNYAALRSHPVLENADSTLNGSSASHEYFANVPADAHVITTTATGQPTTVAYKYLGGAILVTGMTWEHAYANSYSAGKPLLLNAFKYMLGVGVGAQWLEVLTKSVTVAPLSSENVNISFISSNSAAGVHSGKIKINHNGTNTASPLIVPCTLTIGGMKTYSVLQDTIDFGSITQGHKKTDTITISNDGNDSLTVTSFGISNSVFSIAESTPLYVAPFEKKHLAVTYSAANVASESGVVTINTNADVTPQKFVYLKGTGVTAQRFLSSSKDSINMGNVTLGESTSDTFALSNNGNDTITVQTVTASKSTFTIDVASSFKLAPSVSRIITVTYTPVSAGSESANLQVISNAIDNPTLNIALSGKGITTPSIVVNPSYFKVSLPKDDTLTKSLTINNTGETPLEVVLSTDIGDTLSFNTDTSSLAANNNKVLIFRNSLAWSKNSNSTVLTSLGATVKVMTSSAMDTATLDNYELVVFESDQSNSFYQSYVSNFSRFEEYLAKGGKIQFHCATDNSDRIANMEFPGGLKLGGYSGESKNYAALQSHPVLENADSTLNGSSASHEYLTNVPVGAHVITTTLSGQPTTVAYKYLNGAILVTGMTWEHGYSNNYSSGKPLLPNAFSYMLNVKPETSWLQIADYAFTVAPLSSNSTDLKFISKGKGDGTYSGGINIYHNGTNELSPLGVACTMTVGADNVAPVKLKAISDVIYNEDDAGYLTITDLDNVFSDPNGDDLTYSVNVGGTDLLSGAVDGLNRLLVYLGKDKYGVANVIVTATDPMGLHASDTVMVTVNAINDAPVIKNTYGQEIQKNGALTVNLSMIEAFDVEGDDLDISLQSGNNYTVSGQTIYPNTDFVGTLVVPVKVQDYELESALAYLSVVVSLETEIEFVKTDSYVKKFACAPNPAIASTEKVYVQIPDELNGEATVAVFDALGDLLDKKDVYLNGNEIYSWDLCNQSGRRVSTGKYLIVISIKRDDGNLITKKLFFAVKE